MNWVLTVVLCIAVVEVALRLDFLKPLAAILRTSRRSARILRRKAVSDHWKERAMGAYASRTFRASMTLAAMIGAIAAAAIILVLGFDVMAPGFLGFVLGGHGILASIVVVTAYIWIRRKFARE